MVARLRWFFCFLVCFVALNPVFLALNIRGYLLLLVLTVFTLLGNRLRVTRAHVIAYVVIAVHMTGSLVSTAANDAPQPLIFGLFFALSALVVLQTSDSDARAMVSVASHLFAIFIALSAVGVLYHLAGGAPILALPNPDGRVNHLYLTTFSNAETFTIRPSAIYDEAGAFSFYICVLVIMRSRLGLSPMGSAALLFGGLLTQSITHVMFTLLWFAWVLLRRDATARTVDRDVIRRVRFSLLFVVLTALAFQSGLLEWALARAVFFYTNPLTNPREIAMVGILDAVSLNPAAVWFGFDDACIQRLPDCSGLGENPLTPLTYGGLFASWPYYLVLFLALLAPFLSRDGLLLAGAALLLVQRPYLLEFPYSALFALAYVVWFRPAAHQLADKRINKRLELPVPSAPFAMPSASTNLLRD